MERGEPLDRAERRISGVDRVDKRTTDPSYKHVLFKGVITALISATWRDEGRRIKRAIDRRASIACAVDHRRSIMHVAFLKSYNGRDASARIASQPSDRDPRSEIEAFL